MGHRQSLPLKSLVVDQCQSERGFTLVELLCVIVVLGIVASVAVPRIIDLRSDANKATIEGLAGAIRSADGIFASYSLVKGSNKKPYAVWPDGARTSPKTISLRCGHLSATMEGVGRALQGTAENMTGVDGSNYVFAQNSALEFVFEWNQVRWRMKTAPDPNRCSVVYEHYPDTCDGTEPYIEVTTSGC
jgi:prepilin-type N-terminal cleavage/methylation domain-containing protein